MVKNYLELEQNGQISSDFLEKEYRFFGQKLYEKKFFKQSVEQYENALSIRFKNHIIDSVFFEYLKSIGDIYFEQLNNKKKAIEKL